MFPLRGGGESGSVLGRAARCRGAERAGEAAAELQLCVPRFHLLRSGTVESLDVERLPGAVILRSTAHFRCAVQRAYRLRITGLLLMFCSLRGVFCCPQESSISFSQRAGPADEPRVTFAILAARLFLPLQTQWSYRAREPLRPALTPPMPAPAATVLASMPRPSPASVAAAA